MSDLRLCQPRCAGAKSGRQRRCRIRAAMPAKRLGSHVRALGTRFANLCRRETMPRFAALTALVALSTASVACAVHDPVPVFRSAVFVGERGISVPLPPPSLTAMPKQDVDVEGSVQGDDDVRAGTVLHVVDNRGDGDVEAELDARAQAFQVSLTIDVSDSCLELWLEAPDGTESMRNLFSTRIVDDQTIEVLEGCSE